jgi:hypothetical protein
MIAAGLAMMVLALAAAFMVALSEQGAVEDRDQDLDREEHSDERAGDLAGERGHRR